jgi:hypothetical protein
MVSRRNVLEIVIWLCSIYAYVIGRGNVSVLGFVLWTLWIPAMILLIIPLRANSCLTSGIRFRNNSVLK